MVEANLLIALRNLFVLGIVISVSCFRPENSLALVRPLVAFWRRLKLYQTSIAARFRSSRREHFWEIDMTKFEP